VDGFGTRSGRRVPGPARDAILWGQPESAGRPDADGWPDVMHGAGAGQPEGLHLGAFTARWIIARFRFRITLHGRDVTWISGRGRRRVIGAVFSKRDHQLGQLAARAPEAKWDRPAAHVVNPVMVGNTPSAFREACQIIKDRLLALPDAAEDRDGKCLERMAGRQHAGAAKRSMGMGIWSDQAVFWGAGEIG